MTRVRWSNQSLNELEEILLFIARNAPRTADDYVERLIRSVESLRQFPLSGGIVPELARQDIREIIRGNYRIVYRASDDDVEIPTVHHAARLLGDKGSDFV